MSEYTQPTMLEMIGHRRAIPGATGVHLTFQGREGMGAAGWRKSNEDSGRQQDGASVALLGHVVESLGTKRERLDSIPQKPGAPRESGSWQRQGREDWGEREEVD